MDTVLPPDATGTDERPDRDPTRQRDTKAAPGDAALPTAVSRVAICMCTFRRPLGLERALRGIARQRFDRVDPPVLCVVVADNEGSDAARDVTARFTAEYGIETIYVVESMRGISHARNACLDAVPDTADFVAWMDDDQEPRPDWLEELLIGIRETRADVISGPVLPVFPAGTPEWVVEGRFFASPRSKRCDDGAAVTFGVMANVLFRADFLRRHGVRFNHRFALMGGEDRRFWLDILDQGASMTWTSKAVADHLVPLERVTLSYIVGREFSVGCAAAFIQRTNAAGSSIPVTWILSVVGRLITDIVRFIPNLLVNAVRRRAYPIVKNILDIVNLSGRLYGYFGLRYEHYR